MLAFQSELRPPCRPGISTERASWGSNTKCIPCRKFEHLKASLFIPPPPAPTRASPLQKTDMESKRVVSRARAEQFATEVGGILCETSAKENWGVNELFARVSQARLRQVSRRDPSCVVYCCTPTNEGGCFGSAWTCAGDCVVPGGW